VTYKCTREIPFPGPAGTHFEVGCAWVQRGQQQMVLLDACLIDRLTHECDHPLVDLTHILTSRKSQGPTDHRLSHVDFPTAPTNVCCCN
jgi:hypothetical protein